MHESIKADYNARYGSTLILCDNVIQDYIDGNEGDEIRLLHKLFVRQNYPKYRLTVSNGPETAVHEMLQSDIVHALFQEAFAKGEGITGHYPWEAMKLLMESFPKDTYPQNACTWILEQI